MENNNNEIEEVETNDNQLEDTSNNYNQNDYNNDNDNVKQQQTTQKQNQQEINNKVKEEINYDDYQPDSRYKNLFEDENYNELIDSCKEIAKYSGLNNKQFANMTNFIQQVLENVGVFDTRSEIEKQAEVDNYVKTERGKLGENADAIIKSNLEFIDNFGMLNEEQRECLKEFAIKDARTMSAFNILKTCIMNDSINSIPTDINIGGLPDDYTLAKEYYDEKTDDRRREEILRQRLDAGRRGFLPIINK